MKISLKTKLMASFFILIALPMGILGYVSYTMSANSLQSSIQQQLKKQTSDTSALIEKTIESAKRSIKTASLNSEVGNVAQNLNTADIDTAFEYIQNIQKNNQDFMEILI